MPLIPNPTTDLIEHVLRFRNQRQDVIASNIANADTPGYHAFELVLDHELGGAGGAAPLRRTDPRHVSGESAAQSPAGRTVAVGGPRRLDGNDVSLDEEFVKLTENRVMYEAGFELYEGYGGLMRLAREVR